MPMFHRRRPTVPSAAAIAVTAWVMALAHSGAAAADDFETAGDVLAVLLPLSAGYCAVRQGEGGDFLAGFLAQGVVVGGLKYGLGESDLNQRPNGQYQGFPSGHMSAATFGATSLAQKCFPETPALGALAYGLALAVGASRIEADKHNAGQVAVGAVIGYFANGVTVSAGPGSFSLGYTLNF